MYDSIDSPMDVTEKMIFWFTDVQFNLASKLHSLASWLLLVHNSVTILLDT
jgi:hypothetical protein